MPPEPAFASLAAFSEQYAGMIEALYMEADARHWELTREVFAEALRRSAEKRFRGGRAGDLEIRAYLKSLRLADLALACACAEGLETAWEFFIGEYRAELRRAAASILHSSGSPDEARAAELADSLYAELYGLRSGKDAPRKSLFVYFHGRSKLSTWLHAVLAQRHVDLVRGGGEMVSLDAGPEEEGPARQAATVLPTQPDPHREMYLSRLCAALSEALGDLPAGERMMLSYYYLDRLTLAEIGRIMREHESTVSRQLERTRRDLRERVTERLRVGVTVHDGRAPVAGLDDAQIERAFAYALEDWPFDLNRALAREEAGSDPPG